MKQSLLYDWKHNLKPFGRGGAIKPLHYIGGKGPLTDLNNELMTSVFVEQTLALPRSAKDYGGLTDGHNCTRQHTLTAILI